MSVSHYPTLGNQRRFWDRHWQNWEGRKTINEWSLKRNGAILAFLRSLSLDHPTILDLGCGPGWFTESLAHFGKVTAIDLSEEAITRARSQFPHITFVPGNLFEIPLPAGHFDVVTSQEVISHVEFQVEYLDRAAYVLKPGGYLILSTDNQFVMDRSADVGWAPQPPEHIERYLDMKGLKRLLRSHFRVLRSTTILPMGQGGILRLINSYKVNTALEFLIPRQYLTALKERAGFGYKLIVLAQKRS